LDLQTYATRYDFRAPRVNEDPAAYRAALIAHVERRDFAAAHELRVGRPQAAWTAAEVQEFKRWMMNMAGPRQEFPPGTVKGFPIIRDEGPLAATEATMLGIADRGLAYAMELRRTRRKAREAQPILINVLLTTGVLLTTHVQRGDRVALLKQLARTEPVFGFFIVFDAWMHKIDERDGTASRVDAIVAQVGTRDLRLTKVRPYRIYPNGSIKFDPTPAFDLDWKRDDLGVDAHDPYAEIFVSTPPAAGRPS
jgi:hypothetical protein